MTAELGIWVYAVAGRDDGTTPPRRPGVSGAQVRLACAGAFTAVVSDVELAEFGADALRHNLEDLSWLEAVARAHHGVIDAAAQRCTLLPMRLATVYESEASMAAALKDHEAQFQAALRRLRGRAEWGVKGYAAPSAPAAAPAAVAPPEGAATAGMAYLRRRRDALATQRESRQGAADSARAAHVQLTWYAAESCLHPPQSPQLSNRADTMVLNAAYLLDDDRAGQFAQAVAALNDRDQRLRLELTGPWPPYSFAGPDLGGPDGEDQEDALWPPHRRQPRPHGSRPSGSRSWTCWTEYWRGA